jgi:hypothetical protein
MKTRHDDALWDDDERGERVVAVGESAVDGQTYIIADSFDSSIFTDADDSTCTSYRNS